MCCTYELLHRQQSGVQPDVNSPRKIVTQRNHAKQREKLIVMYRLRNEWFAQVVQTFAIRAEDTATGFCKWNVIYCTDERVA